MACRWLSSSSAFLQSLLYRVPSYKGSTHRGSISTFSNVARGCSLGFQQRNWGYIKLVLELANLGSQREKAAHASEHRECPKWFLHCREIPGDSYMCPV